MDVSSLNNISSTVGARVEKDTGHNMSIFVNMCIKIWSLKLSGVIHIKSASLLEIGEEQGSSYQLYGIR